jgi:RNA polymerase sigma-70 factor, ECF subfamily
MRKGAHEANPRGPGKALNGMDSTIEIRRTADRIEGGTEGRLRRRRRLERSHEGDALTLRAVRRAQGGDADAMRLLYLRFADNVYGYVCSIVRHEHDAEDVTQQIFSKLLTSLQRYEPSSVPFSAWILRVARNVAVDHMRSRRAIPCEEVRELDQHHSDSETDRLRSLSLRDALATLPEEQREVLVLRHLVGLSPGEIAGRLGRTEPSVHGLHHRGRGALRSVLTEMECAPAAAGVKVAA